MRKTALIVLGVGVCAAAAGCISLDDVRRVAHGIADGQADPVLDAVTGVLGPAGLPVKGIIKGLAALAGVVLGTEEVATGGKRIIRPACRKIHAGYHRMRHGKWPEAAAVAAKAA